jgi:hypothetical protein
MYYYIPSYADEDFRVLFSLHEYLKDLYFTQVEQNEASLTTVRTTPRILEEGLGEAMKLKRRGEDLTGYYDAIAAQKMYHYSVPVPKMHYPEAFIASPSTIHDDIFFIHILQFQY